MLETLQHTCTCTDVLFVVFLMLNMFQHTCDYKKVSYLTACLATHVSNLMPLVCHFLRHERIVYTSCKCTYTPIYVYTGTTNDMRRAPRTDLAVADEAGCKSAMS